MDIQRLNTAAVHRRGQVARQNDRPRRRTHAPNTPPTAGGREPVTVRAAMTVRADTDARTVHFHGLASAYDQPYAMYDFFGPYSEVVSAGAAAKSLARADLSVPLVLQHDPMRRIASTDNDTLTLAETSAGLEVDAPELDPDDADVAYILPKLRSGLIREMSFMFQIVRGTWSPDYTEYRIDEFELHKGDVSIVAYGANPNTSTELRHSSPVFITEDDTRRRMLVL